MRLLALFAPTALVAACAMPPTLPEPPGGAGDAPGLVSLAPVLAEADRRAAAGTAPGGIVTAEAKTTARAAGLRSRAEALRRSVLSPAEEARLAEEITP